MWPDKQAISCNAYNLTYEQLHSRVLGLANFFLAHGLAPGDRVAIMHHNCHKFLESYFAASYTGLILVPINYRLSESELGFILEDSGAKILISNWNLSSTVSKVLQKHRDSISLEKVIWSGTEEIRNSDIEGYLSIDYEKVLSTARTCKFPNLENDDSPVHLYYTSGTILIYNNKFSLSSIF